jgi:DNA polymerase III alpha subunit
LIKIYSFSAKNGFYYEPRIDFDTLKTLWDDKDLSLAVPFYDSFLHKNSLYGSICLPDFSFSKPTFFVEDNDLPFDPILTKLVNDYANKKYEIVRTKSIFYKNRKDFKSYLTFKCINKRTTLDKPEIEHMCSNEFSFEGWKEQNV